MAIQQGQGGAGIAGMSVSLHNICEISASWALKTITVATRPHPAVRLPPDQAAAFCALPQLASHCSRAALRCHDVFYWPGCACLAVWFLPAWGYCTLPSPVEGSRYISASVAVLAIVSRDTLGSVRHRRLHLNCFDAYPILLMSCCGTRRWLVTYATSF